MGSTQGEIKEDEEGKGGKVRCLVTTALHSQCTENGDD
jgi:hypothetical protein